MFCSQLTDEAARGSFPPEVVRNIFSNVSSIYVFHSQFLLPDLEKCISHWWVDVLRTTRVVLLLEAVEEGYFLLEKETCRSATWSILKLGGDHNQDLSFFPSEIQEREARPR